MNRTPDGRFSQGDKAKAKARRKAIAAKYGQRKAAAEAVRDIMLRTGMRREGWLARMKRMLSL